MDELLKIGGQALAEFGILGLGWVIAAVLWWDGRRTNQKSRDRDSQLIEYIQKVSGERAREIAEMTEASISLAKSQEALARMIEKAVDQLLGARK